MSATGTVKTFITALQSGDMEMAASHMSDDFVLTGWTFQPLDKREFLAVQSELLSAMPDYSFNLSDAHEQDGVVTALIRISGTHTGDLSLPMFGVPLIPYTGIAVDLPQVRSEYRVDDENVAEMRIESVPGGGLAGLLQQVGTELPVLPRLKDKLE